jgi:UDP-glucose 4-epimerase
MSHSFFDLVASFEKVCGLKIKKAMIGRCAGSLLINFAKSAKANQLLKWQATRSLDQIFRSTWHYLQNTRLELRIEMDKKIHNKHA